MTVAPARQVEHKGFHTAYLEAGPVEGVPIMAVHGSGPGVSAAANWSRLLDSSLSTHRRMIAPDVVGFGASHSDGPFDHDARVSQLVDLLDVLELGEVDLIGNSMGGGLALALAHRVPKRIRSMVLMGSVGVHFELTYGLAKVWGYRPSLSAMRELMTLFAYDPTLVSDELVALRYETSREPTTRARYEAAFTEPLQQHIESMALPDEVLREIRTPTLLIHGAQDQVVPLETSLHLVDVLPVSDLVVFGACGHWTQIERHDDFVTQVETFFGRIAARQPADRDDDSEYDKKGA